MLKIKDNVDLKELEKYGFVCVDREDLWYYFNQENGMKVNYGDGELDYYLCELTNDFVYTLYDLIKDGLVEKVEE